MVDAKGVFMNLQRIYAMAISSNPTTALAQCKAIVRFVIRKGNVCSIPPIVAAIAVIVPLIRASPWLLPNYYLTKFLPVLFFCQRPVKQPGQHKMLLMAHLLNQQ